MKYVSIKSACTRRMCVYRYRYKYTKSFHFEQIRLWLSCSDTCVQIPIIKGSLYPNPPFPSTSDALLFILAVHLLLPLLFISMQIIREYKLFEGGNTSELLFTNWGFVLFQMQHFHLEMRSCKTQDRRWSYGKSPPWLGRPYVLCCVVFQAEETLSLKLILG